MLLESGFARSQIGEVVKEAWAGLLASRRRMTYSGATKLNACRGKI
jgi:hypothetical protein